MEMVLNNLVNVVAEEKKELDAGGSCVEKSAINEVEVLSKRKGTLNGRNRNGARELEENTLES